MTKFKREKFPDKKTNTLKEYKQLFQHSTAAYLLKYEGLNVENFTKFRRDLDKLGASLKVVKNRLAKLAVQDTAYQSFDKELVEGVAVVFDTQDPLATVKLVAKAQDAYKVKLLSGIFQEDASYYDTQALLAMSKLPPKEELIAKLLFLLNAPITRFARTLNEVPSGLVRVLHQIATKEA